MAARRCARASASPPRAARAATCCATPTSRCTRRRPRAATACVSFDARCTRRCSPAWRWRTTCAARSTADELYLAFQPIVDLETGALLRRRGAPALEPPAPRQRAAGRVHPARRGDRPDRPDRRLGARAGVPHGGRLGPGCPVTVNVSSVQLRSAEFADTVAAALRRRRPARASRLTIEITETVLMTDVDAHRRAAARAEGARRADRDRRLRHRPLVAAVPPAAPARHAQDPEAVHRRARRPGRRRRARARDPRARPQLRPARDRRGDRDRAPARAAARARLHARAGLPVRPPARRPRRSPASPRSRSPKDQGDPRSIGVARPGTVRAATATRRHECPVSPFRRGRRRGHRAGGRTRGLCRDGISGRRNRPLPGRATAKTTA